MSRILATLAVTLALASAAAAAPMKHTMKPQPSTSSDFASQFFADMQRNIGG